MLCERSFCFEQNSGRKLIAVLIDLSMGLCSKGDNGLVIIGNEAS
jgi:hypothetical protein